MAEKTCPDCAEKVQEAARVCKHCGYRFDGGRGTPVPPRPAGANPASLSPGDAQPREHPDGTTVLVLGILGLLLCGVLAPFAWIRGKRAVAEIDGAPPGTYTNRGSAQAGKVMGIVGTSLWLAAIAIYVIVAIGVFASGSASRSSSTSACETDTKTIKVSILAWNTEFLGGEPSYPTAYPASMDDLIDAQLLIEPSSLHTISGNGSTVPTISKIEGECEDESISQLD